MITKQYQYQYQSMEIRNERVGELQTSLPIPEFGAYINLLS